MADVRVIGAVAVKVRPDTDGFRDRTKREILNQLRNFEADIDINPNIDERELDREVQNAKKRVQKKMTLAWHTDYDSIDRAVKQVERKLKDLSAMTLDVEINKDDLGAAEDLLKDLRTGAKVKMEVASDERGFKEVLGKIQALQRERLLKTVEFATDEESLNRMASDYSAKLAELSRTRTIDIDILPDRKGFASAIAMIDKELDKFNTRKFRVEVDEQSLREERARLEEILTGQPYEMKVDWGNRQSLDAVKRELEEKLSAVRAVSLLVDPDEQSIQDAIDQIDDAIREAESNDVDLTTVAHTAASSAQLAYVARGRFADIFVRVNKRSLALAEGLLQSLAGVNVLRSLGRSLENLAINFDKVAIKAAGTGAVLGGVINTLSYASTAMLAIGEGVFQAVGLLAAAPAMLAALTASIVITKAAFEDFGAAVDGDNEALAKLPANAQAAANALRGTWEMIQQPTQNAFWEGMGSSMADVVEVIMPQFRDGLAKSAVHAGRFTAGVMNSFKKLALSGDLNTMFDNLSGMFDNAAGAAEPLFDAINRLGLRGSEYLPRFGQWLTDIATRFDNWIKISDESGAINRWIEDGIASLKDMWGVAGSVVDIFKALTRAANTAGQLGLGAFNDNLRETADMMLGEPFQTRLSNIFRGANKGASELNVGVKALGRAFGESSEFVADMLTKLGILGGGLLSGIARTFSEIRFQSGVTDAIDGMNAAIRDLAPAFSGIGNILGEFGSVAGEVFRNIAPVIRTVVDTLERGMSRLGPALVAISGPLTDILGGLVAGLSGPILGAIDVLSGAIEALADAPPIVQAVVAALGALIALKFGGFFTAVAAGMVTMSGAFTAGLGPIAAAKGALKGLYTMMGGPLGLALGATAIGIAGIGIEMGKASKAADAMRESLDRSTGAFTDGSLDEAMKQLNSIPGGFLGANKAMQGLTSLWGGNAADPSEIFGALGTSLEDVAQSALGATPMFDDLMGKLQDVKKVMQDGGDWEAYAREVGFSDEAISKFSNKGLSNTIGRMQDLKNATSQSKDDWKDWHGEVEEAEAPLSKLGENMQVLADHTGDASDRVRALKDSLDILNGITPTSEEALRKVNESMAGIGGVFVDAEGAVHDFSAAIDAAGKIDTSTAGGQGLYDDVTRLSDEWLALATAMSADGYGTDAISVKLAGLQAEFAKSGEAAGLSAEQVEAAFQRYMNGTPEQIAMLLTLDDSLFNEKKELTEEGIRHLDSLKAVAELGGDDTNLRMALTTSYTSLEAFDAAVATATANLDPTQADAVKARLITDLVNLANTDPMIAANMDPRFFDIEIARMNGYIAELDQAEPSPEVRTETEEARQRLQMIYDLQSSIDGRNTSAKHIQTTEYRTTETVSPGRGGAGGTSKDADGSIRGYGRSNISKFANGGIAETPGRAKIYTPASSYRIFAEPETGGESYIPLAASKRTRSLAIWRETGKLLGAQEFANGGVSGAGGSSSTQPININVHAAPGMSEQAIGNVAMNALNYQLRNA